MMKTLTFVFFIIHLILIKVAFADSDVVLKLVDKEKYLRVGKITKVVLTSTNQAFLQKIKKNNKGISLGDYLYLYALEFSQEQDKKTTLLGASIILKQLPASLKIPITIDDDQYILTLGEVKFDPSDAQIKAQTTIFQEDYNYKKFVFWMKDHFKKLLFAIVLLLVICSYSFYKIIQKRKIKVEEIHTKNRWLQVLKNAQTRNELEYLYQQKKQWLRYVPIHEAEDFLKYLNSIQYSPEWSEDQLAELLDKFDALRRYCS